MHGVVWKTRHSNPIANNDSTSVTQLLSASLARSHISRKTGSTGVKVFVYWLGNWRINCSLDGVQCQSGSSWTTWYTALLWELLIIGREYRGTNRGGVNISGITPCTIRIVKGILLKCLATRSQVLLLGWIIVLSGIRVWFYDRAGPTYAI